MRSIPHLACRPSPDGGCGWGGIGAPASSAATRVVRSARSSATAASSCSVGTVTGMLRLLRERKSTAEPAAPYNPNVAFCVTRLGLLTQLRRQIHLVLGRPLLGRNRAPMQQLDVVLPGDRQAQGLQRFNAAVIVQPTLGGGSLGRGSLPWRRRGLHCHHSRPSTDRYFLG